MGMFGDDFDRRFAIVAETRRRWSLTEKRKIVAEACMPCANVSAVARRHGVKAALLYRWKKELGGEVATSGATTFVPVTIDEEPVADVPPAPPPPPVTISEPVFPQHDWPLEVRLANGRRILVGTDIDTRALKRIIVALEGCAADPFWRACVAGDGIHRHAQGISRTVTAGAGDVEERPVCRTFVRVSWQAW